MEERRTWWPVLAAVGLLTACSGGAAPIPGAPVSARAPAPARGGAIDNLLVSVTVPLPSKAAGFTGVVFGQGAHSDPIASFGGNVSKSGRCIADARQRVCDVDARLPRGGPFDVVATLYDRYPASRAGAKVLGMATVALDLRDGKVHRLAFATSGALAGARVALSRPSLHAIDPAKIYATVSALDARGNVLLVNAYAKPNGAPAQIELSSTLPNHVLAFKPRFLKKPPEADVLAIYRAKKAPTALVRDGAVATVAATADLPGAKSGKAKLTVLAPAVTNANLANAGAQPAAIAAGPDGALWFCEYASGKVGRITTAMSVTGEYGAFAHPQSIASAGGALWIVENGGAGNVDRIATDGSVSVYPLATNTYPNGISAGRGNVLWFGSNEFDYVGTISTSGAYGATHALPKANGYPDHSVRGPDGNQYFTLNGTGEIAKISQNGTNLRTYEEPGGHGSPEDVASGPDGRVWFTDPSKSTIFALSTSGQFQRYPVPASVGLAGPLAFGPDGKLWFAGANGAGRLDPADGTVAAFALVEGGDPFGIALGPDGALYVTEFATGQISRLQ
jgi:virginiamycin B lyase